MSVYPSTDTTTRAELGEFLRSRRARIAPTTVGLQPGRRRRTPGLRREEVADLETRYAGAGYGTFKRDLAEVMVGALAPIRERAEKILADEAELDRVLAYGAAKAQPVATRTMAAVRDRVGFLPPIDAG